MIRLKHEISSSGHMLICDDCKKEVPDFDTLNQTIHFMADNGWKCHEDNGIHKDICPDCVKKRDSHG